MFKTLTLLTDLALISILLIAAYQREYQLALLTGILLELREIKGSKK